MREHLYKPHTMRLLCHSLLTHPKSVCPVPCHMCPVTPEAMWLDMKYELNALKGPANRKNENLYFSAPAQTTLMQPISVSGAICKKNLSIVYHSVMNLEAHV